MTKASLASELAWLKQNPAFEERPANIRQFIGPDYLDIDRLVRPAVLHELVEIFGETTNSARIALYRQGVFTGSIGCGKTTLVSIALVYMAHWVLCLRDPQHYFDLLPGSRIAFMQMSTSSTQAKEVVFGDIKARIDNSPWFKRKYPYDPSFKNQIRLPKNIWILPGDSAETTFEGYNILGGVLDEADSHKITATKDYAENGYNTIYARIDSRFQDRGFLLIVGQMKKSNGFVMKKYKEFMRDLDAYTCHMKIWESFGWDKFLRKDGTRDSFWFHSQDYSVLTKEQAAGLGFPAYVLEIPNVYKQSFENNPVKALRDLAGIPQLVNSPWLGSVWRLDAAEQRWRDRHGDEGPVNDKNQIAAWFKCEDSLKRHVHVDFGLGKETGDAAAIVMGHVPFMVGEAEGELKPFIEIDLMMRLWARPGTEIQLADLRRIIYELKEVRGFNIVSATMDGYQSTDMLQQLRRKRYKAEQLSVDKNMTPYSDLLDALNEDRVSFPPYEVPLRREEPDLVRIAYKELSELADTGAKIDHPEGGSKDVADGIAACTFVLMGNRTYRSGAVGGAAAALSSNTPDPYAAMAESTTTAPASLHQPNGLFGVAMPSLPGGPMLPPTPWRGR
jgi:hypothetical protein